MSKIALSVFLALIFFLTTLSLSWAEEVEPARKEPVVAFAVALIPGSVVHGLGHYYAGDPETGKTLLVTEGVSLVLVLVGGAILSSPDLFGGCSSDCVIGAISLSAGTIGFVGSWVYDVIGSPFAAQRYNRKLEKTETSWGISAYKHEDKVLLTVSLSF